ncbi:MAG: hypothetical protein J6B89_03505 [Bacilli bacterium]|nr:hypothetical protein [Bacilli bacterium]
MKKIKNTINKVENKIINYFFDEDELELIAQYKFLGKISIVSAIIVIMTVIA